MPGEQEQFWVHCLSERRHDMGYVVSCLGCMFDCGGSQTQVRPHSALERRAAETSAVRSSSNDTRQAANRIDRQTWRKQGKPRADWSPACLLARAKQIVANKHREFASLPVPASARCGSNRSCGSPARAPRSVLPEQTISDNLHSGTPPAASRILYSTGAVSPLRCSTAGRALPVTRCPVIRR